MSSKKSVKVEVKKDNTKQLLKQLESMKRLDLLVGVPQEEAEREDGEITNAQLMFIHSEGSPARNIPPRPVIDMTLKEEKQKINDKFKKAINNVLSGGNPRTELERLGIYVVNKIKAKFGSEDLAPLQPATIKAKGSDRPLIDTGQLRNSITYIIRGKNDKH